MNKVFVDGVDKIFTKELRDPELIRMKGRTLLNIKFEERVEKDLQASGWAHTKNPSSSLYRSHSPLVDGVWSLFKKGDQYLIVESKKNSSVKLKNDLSGSDWEEIQGDIKKLTYLLEGDI